MVLAVAAFAHAGERTVCLQARLRYWNDATNLLTRMFALEYGYWFGIMLPGLDRLACRSRGRHPTTSAQALRAGGGTAQRDARTPTWAVRAAVEG